MSGKEHLTIKFPEAFIFFNRRLQDNLQIVYPICRRSSLKDIIESLGVPHTEIGAIEINGEDMEFGFVPRQSCRIVLYPIAFPFDVTLSSILRPDPLKKLRFIVDVNVGKLAVLLRMIGMNTAYNNEFTDSEIARKAESDGRVVLSKDIGLLKRKQIHYGRYVRAIHPDDQLKEIINFFGIQRKLFPFSRCVRCNTKLVPVDKKDVLNRLEPNTQKYFNHFKLCTTCNRIFWKGSHHESMEKRLKKAGIKKNFKAE